MQVTKEQLDPCKIQLTIEVDADQAMKAVDEVYREFSQSKAIPGFRKGKAPRAILERVVLPEAVKERAIEIMISPAYFDAIEQEKIEPYADPHVEIVKYESGEPFSFKAEIPLPPQVKLGEYKGIKVEKRKVDITDEDVDAQLKYLQESRATTEKVEGRGLQTTDVAIADISSAPVGEEMPAARRSFLQMGGNMPGFDENIIGMNPGERKVFELTYPEDFADKDVAGKKFSFDVAIETIRERKMPEIDDEFAKTVGDFETVDALKEDIRKHLLQSAEEAAEREVEHKIVDEIVFRSEIFFPDVMVNHEVHHDLEDLHARLERQGMTIEQYLKRIDKSQEDFIKEMREEAAKGIKNGLALGDVIEAEKLEVTDEDVDAEIAGIAEKSGADAASVEEYLKKQGGRPSLRSSMLNKKVFDFLKSVSEIS